MLTWRKGSLKIEVMKIFIRVGALGVGGMDSWQDVGMVSRQERSGDDHHVMPSGEWSLRRGH